MKTLLTTFMTLTLFFTAPLIGAEEKKDSPKTVDGAITVDASEAKQLFDQEVMFIDVRKDKDWKAGRIPGAEHLELKKVYSDKTLGEFVKKDQLVVIYCNGPKCLRSSKASAKAVGWGFKKVRYFRGGLPAWKVAKYPVE
jgi:rhodanese-related sulfurtransferase